MNLCTFPECGRKVKSRGLCEGHRKQAARGIELAPLRLQPRRWGATCNVDGCDRIHKSGGLCNVHYMVQYRGLPLVNKDAQTADLVVRAKAAYRDGATIVEVAHLLGVGHIRARKLIGDAFDPARADRYRAAALAKRWADHTPKPRKRPATVSTAPAPGHRQRAETHTAIVVVDTLGLPPLAPIRWEPDADPDRQARLALAAIARCTGDRRAATRMLGITWDQLMRALSTARTLGLAA